MSRAAIREQQQQARRMVQLQGYLPETLEPEETLGDTEPMPLDTERGTTGVGAWLFYGITLVSSLLGFVKVYL